MTRPWIVLLSAFAMVLATGAASHAKIGKRSDDHAGFIGATGRIDPHARYENDIAYEFGTVSRRGSQTIPYVERCHWTAKPSTFFFTGLTQVCTRHTLENTQ
ncbi:MAG TPA: hypothetical protein VH933_09695 [Aestuariivirgaceae bacterium]|jgi:hypothetical protein